ncbi:hypothetical protein OG432_15180 [Streptomyces sp. NBC_00442]|uniref:hypothetical protein n=1 Tax=Streptomyces sp. NBC_00442 TaxID=2903651 RepID=UPI002E1DC7E6
MLIMEAVLETYDVGDFTLWPVAAPRPDRLLPLSGRMSPEEVGAAMAVLAAYHCDDEADDVPDAEADAEADGGRAAVRALRHLLSVDVVTAPGGLALTDTAAGITIAPGCCFGLENWRDWSGLGQDQEVWLGHDTVARVERLGDLVRVWPDTTPPAPAPIALRPAELTELLGGVREQLTAFLSLAHAWTRDHAPDLAPALVTKLAEDLNVRGPLTRA